MPKRKAPLLSGKFLCWICQEVLKDPMTVRCGHSFCGNCIKSHWEEENDKGIYSCPQCRKRFRPTLWSNIVKHTLAEVENNLKKPDLQDAAARPCYAGPKDVACDVCTWWKMKAVKSCLVCLESYCKEHLQDHNKSSAFKIHKLVEPSKKVQEICSDHNKAQKSFCHTDQQRISYPCNMDQHRGHETVPAAAERNEKQRVEGVSRQTIQQRIQEREEDVKQLQHEMQAIGAFIDEAVDHTEVCFAKMICLLQKRSNEVKQQLRSRQQTALRGVKELQEKLEQELEQLKRKDDQLEQLTHREQQSQFLHSSPSMSAVSEHTPYFSVETAALRYLEDVAAAVSENRETLQHIMRETSTDFLLRCTEKEEPLPPQPETREDFLQYSQQIHLDPNTAHNRLFLCDGNRKVIYTRRDQHYPHHPDRFTGTFQVLSKESLTERCYWEVERRGTVDIAVTYNNIPRSGYGSEGLFGFNDKSWSLACDSERFTFLHNNEETPISVPPSFRVGVYLDPRAGVLSFYSVAETMTLLHRVRTTFTQPLHAGITVFNERHNAKLVKPQ